MEEGSRESRKRSRNRSRSRERISYSTIQRSREKKTYRSSEGGKGDERRERGHRTRSPERSTEARPRWGKKEEYENLDDSKTTVVEKEKANFGLSGALMEDEDTGATLNGVKLKWSEPPEGRKPSSRWRLYVFKQEKQIETLHIHRQSAYLIGRDSRVADIVALHPSISSQHAVIQFRLRERRDAKKNKVSREIRPYLMDLESRNGTMINKQKIETARYVELRERDLINFGTSTRDYVLLHEGSRSS